MDKHSEDTRAHTQNHTHTDTHRHTHTDIYIYIYIPAGTDAHQVTIILLTISKPPLIGGCRILDINWSFGGFESDQIPIFARETNLSPTKSTLFPREIAIFGGDVTHVSWTNHHFPPFFLKKSQFSLIFAEEIIIFHHFSG